MAPTKGKSGPAKSQSKGSTKSSKSGSSSKSKTASRSSATQKSTKSKVSKPKSTAAHKAKKRRHYTEKELDIQKLNMITPMGVNKPNGKKKGKVFVDDQESLMTILAMVNADKEGQIESKMLRARQLEEVRQARIRETEARAESKKQKLEDVKDELRKKKTAPRHAGAKANPTTSRKVDSAGKKRVSFDG